MDSESESGIVNLGRGKRRKTKASHFDELPFNITSSDNGRHLKINIRYYDFNV